MTAGPSTPRMVERPAFDVVVVPRDESAVDGAALERRLRREHFDQVAGRLSILRPAGHPGAGEAGVAGLNRAVAAAVAARRHLLVVFADTLPGLDCVGRLVETFAADPMIGFASPRFATPDGERLFPLPLEAAPLGAEAYPRALLPHLPELYLCPELLSAVVLIRRETLTGLRTLDPGLPSVAAALVVIGIQGRRLGFRTAVVNRAVTPAGSRALAYPALEAGTVARIADEYPCHAVARSWFTALSAHRREAKLATALNGGPARRLLFDVRGLREFHNGSSVAILGMLDGIMAREPGWSIDLWASARAERRHRLSERYPRARLILDRPEQTYAVAIRLSQPWGLHTLAELHAHALRVGVAIFDTIMWDVIYPCSPSVAAELSGTWEFAATYLDGLLFISEYSRRRFEFRFPGAGHVRHVVSGLSFDPADYASAAPPRREEARGDILVFGNDYDHKWVAGALEWIADAFPFAAIFAFGATQTSRPNVRAVPSGELSVDEMHRLYARVKVVCFPSFYEGFGLPVFEGLAHGLDVVARRSGLLDEMAAQYRGPGRILPFDDPLSLIESIGRSLAGQDVETLPLGTALPAGQRPAGWSEVAGRILRLVDDLAADRDAGRHDAREAALRMLRPAHPQTA